MSPMSDEGKANLHELYLHLDHVVAGDRYMAFYGQLRAEGKDHSTALSATVTRFDLAQTSWYQLRMKRKDQRDAEQAEREAKRQSAK